MLCSFVPAQFAQVRSSGLGLSDEQLPPCNALGDGEEWHDWS